MKELSTEQKAKAYDLAIDAAKKYHNGTLKDVMETIFPELTENSEDERIRKEILEYFQQFENEGLRGINVSDWLAWLEKQSDANKEYWRGYREGKKEILDKYSELKKQGEQKPIDKVEPKFHEGEWITNGDYTWKIVEVKPLDYILQSQDGNIVDDTISHVDEQFHSFTIEDAKEGDVLINWNNTIFIFKAIEDETVKFHIAYNEKWDAIKTPSTKLSHLGLPEPQFEFHPATKEQRNTLMKAMTDAGYTFDFEKKELKKIELNPDDIIEESYRQQADDLIDIVTEKPAWSEEDEDNIFNIVGALDVLIQREIEKEHNGDRNAYPKYYRDLQDWLKSLKQRYTWKPSEEQMENLSRAFNGGAYRTSLLMELYQDLKKLSDK